MDGADEGSECLPKIQNNLHHYCVIKHINHCSHLIDIHRSHLSDNITSQSNALKSPADHGDVSEGLSPVNKELFLDPRAKSTPLSISCERDHVTELRKTFAAMPMDAEDPLFVGGISGDIAEVERMVHRRDDMAKSGRINDNDKSITDGVNVADMYRKSITDISDNCDRSILQVDKTYATGDHMFEDTWIQEYIEAGVSQLPS